jgi:hypothetical protein
MTLSEYFERITKDGYFVDEALVLGPYISSHFFSEGIFAQRTKKKGKAQFPKSRLTIIADQSWDDAQLNSIEDVYSGGREICLNASIRSETVASSPQLAI